MKKRWLPLLLALMLLVGCSGENNGTPPDTGEPKPPVSGENGGGSSTEGGSSGKEEQGDVPEEPVLAELREAIADSGALFGVAYLGYAELPTFEDIAVYVEANGFCEAFPFLLDVTEDRAVLQEGGEVYVVVPAAADITITVSEFLMPEDAYIPERGEDLLQISDGRPLLLRGNVSEIVSNLLITAEGKDGQSVTCNPCISGMDGSLVPEEGVYDFTVYEMLPGGYDEVPDLIYTGTWYARHLDGDYDQMAMTLVLDPSGYASYGYGFPYSEPLEYFEGRWMPDGEDHLILYLYGGPVVNEAGESKNAEPYEITCVFRWDYQGSALVLCHEDGSPLLHGTEEAWYTFMPFDGFHLVNHWFAVAEAQEIYYDLQLLDNGECIFELGDADGNQLVYYGGWWYLEDDVLSMNMLRQAGQHPEDPELDYISGEYLVESPDLGDMTLTFISGHILTLDMEETTRQQFFGY